MDPLQRIPEQFDKGFHESLADTAAGSPKLYWQTRGSWGELLIQRMADRFGISVQPISDMTSARELSYQSGYNEAIKSHIARTFGQDSFSCVLNEVEAHRVETYKRYIASRDAEQR